LTPRSTSTRKQQREPVFWVDENLGSAEFVSRLRVNNLSVIHGAFPDGTPDLEWIPRVAANRWVAITKDKLKADLEEQIALVRTGARVFVLVGDASHGELAELFISKLKWVKRMLSQNDGAFLGKIYVKNGETSIATATDLCDRSPRRWGRR
jgi:hypothetical protein